MTAGQEARAFISPEIQNTQLSELRRLTAEDYRNLDKIMVILNHGKHLAVVMTWDRFCELCDQM